MMAEIDHARIKRNVSKMISLGAPEADIDAYVASENVTPEQLRAASSTPAEPEDPIKAQVRGELADMRKQGVPVDNGMGRQFLQGATFNLADEALAALSTPMEMVKRRTINPVEGYNYAKAREDILMEDARKRGGAMGVGMEMLGGFGTGSGLARGGATFMPKDPATASFARRVGGALADGVVLGGVSGAADAVGTDRIGAGLTGAAVGGGVAGGLTAAAPLARAVAAPTMGWVRGVTNPEGFAQSQIARAVSESGQPVSQLAREIADARASGQPYTLADALGNSGQRMLSAVTRAPGEGRTQAVDFLNARQADQSSRVGQFIDEALGVNGKTSAQTSAELMAKAKVDSEPLYQAALSKKPVWSDRFQEFLDDPITKNGLARGVEIQRLEALAKGEKFNPTDIGITGFNEAGEPIRSKVPNMRTINVIKKGFDAILDDYRSPISGKLMLDERGRAVDMVRKSFLTEVDKLNPTYAEARKAWAGPASVDSAIDLGEFAATRGRAADNIQRFSELPAAQQQGYRSGYADKLASKLESMRPTYNASADLVSPKRQAELSALSLYQGPSQPGISDQLTQRLARENRMFETRGQALGGSRTADNLADAEALGINPEIVGNLLSGNVGTAAKNLIFRSGNALSGNTPKVREELAKILLSGDAQGLESQIMKTISKDKAFKQKMAQILSGATAGVTLPTYNANRR